MDFVMPLGLLNYNEDDLGFKIYVTKYTQHHTNTPDTIPWKTFLKMMMF
jgi:hypothetical protein